MVSVRKMMVLVGDVMDKVDGVANGVRDQDRGVR